ncbi:MAG: SlyX family protein [Halieaceae bacterium]|nr:SlyX family protein [Halieaceae bacterium]
MSNEEKLQALQQQVVELQTQLAFQEQAINELGGVLAEQQRDLAALQREWVSVKDRYASLREQLPDTNPLDEKPPHY